MICEEPSLLKMIKLQPGQYCCKVVAWLRKSSKFLEIHLDYSVYAECLMDTVHFAAFVSLED